VRRSSTEELPVVMRPPIPALTLSRRAKIALSVVAALIVLLIVLNSLVGVYVDWLWFGEVGFRSVYKTIIITRLVLFLIFGVLMALTLGGNMFIAYLLRPPFRPMSTEQQNLERYRVLLEPRKRLILIGIMVLSGLSAGLAALGDWRAWTLWRVGGSFGVSDPQFHRDISFYAWDYPVYRLLLGFGFTAVFFAVLLSVAVHYLFGAIRLQTPGPKITVAARRHLTILVFVFIVLKAIAYWLDRYGLVYSERGKVTGASYTDVNASLPSKTILFWIAVIIAAGVLASLWLKSAQLPAIGFGVLLVLSILISGIYPALVQQFSVKPNASDKEAPYILRNIQATRQAYDIVTKPAGAKDGTVTYVDYATAATPSTAALSTNDATVASVRILDPNVVSPTFTQQQQLQNFYGFPLKLDVDRYKVKGVTNDYIVGVRELKAENLSDTQSNWINKRTVYTHGYGFVAAQANEDVTATQDYTEGDIPQAGPLKLTTPQAYYGELVSDYAIVGAKGSREYDGNQATTTYAGKGGISLGSFFTKLAFGVQYKETNFLLNDAVSSSTAKIMIVRDPRERVQKVAPFLTVDGDPYPVVDQASGHIVWMVDGYTTMSNYPYSEKESFGSLTADSLTAANKTAAQANNQINYIRNSVKATVDAYNGTVNLYAWDDTDPVLKAWRKAFPHLIQSNSAMPQSIREHVRYPEDLFEAQRGLLTQYHVNDPVTFYNQRDKWTVPNDPASTSSQPPYYVLAADPSGNSGTARFQLTSPMKVNNRQNLAAYISVDSDPGPNYGHMTVLRVPSGSVVDGPEQVYNNFNTTTAISKDITLLSGNGSTVIHGNLLTLPIGQSFLYVEPLYVQGSSATGFPILRRILVQYGGRIGYGTSLSQALRNLDQPVVGQEIDQSTATSPGPSPSTPSPPPSSTAPRPPSAGPTTPPLSVSPQIDTLLRQLDAAFTELQNAYKSGDLARIGQAQANLKTLLDQYARLRGPTASASPSR
jgi:uncharacterized membrane protein (UPF0182 family)